MDDLLQKVWEKSRNPYLRALVLAVLVFLSLLGAVSVASDTGFSEEVAQYRYAIWAAAAVVALVTTAVWLSHKRLGWSRYYSAVLAIRERILEKPELGGMRPHLVIGVNQGGAIVGGLLYYVCSRSFHFTTLWVYDDWRVHTREAQLQELARVLETLSTFVSGELRILLVDDSFKTGTAMGRARSLVGEAVERAGVDGHGSVIKSAVLVFRPDLRDEAKGPAPDYHVHEGYTHFPYAKV